MKEIKPVTMFPCPVTGKLFKSKSGAAKSGVKEQKILDARKEIERLATISKEAQAKNADYIRLNLKDVKDLPAMLKEKGKEFFGVDISEISISVSFGQVSNSHGCPLDGVENWSNQHKDRPTSYLGWSGQIKVTATRAQSKNADDSINKYLFNRWGGMGFRGFHTISGCGGSFGKYDMDIGFYFFLSDFPLLVAKHEEFLKEKAKFIQNKANLKAVDDAAGNYAETHPDTQELNKQISALQQKREELTIGLYNQHLKDHPASQETLSSEWEWLKTQFTDGYFGNSWLYD
jgi:hypothetical protein